MKIWQHVRNALPKSLWPSAASASANNAASGDAAQLWKAQNSLRALLDDERVPRAVRQSLAQDYRSLEAMLNKLEHGHVHIAAFGRVSVGKSSVLNALIGTPRFAVSPLHGATLETEMQPWQEIADSGVYFIDTPGINEIDGEQREQLAHEVALRSDLILFIVDGDMTGTELNAIQALARESRPMLLVLNKADHYTENERAQLLSHLAERASGLLPAENVLACSAAPAERVYLMVDESGAEREERRRPPTDIRALRDRLWGILEREGKTLAALNAGLFAGRLSDQVAARMTEAQAEVAERVVRNYCIAKGVAVAVNPVPVTDLVAAAALDVSLVVHLGKAYGLSVSRREAGALVRVIITQMAVLMGAVWGVHLVSSSLKIASAGLSTALTAGSQAAVAYYATYVVGQAAKRYLARGKSWGEGGPKRAVEDILDGIDRDSVLRQAREQIRTHLYRG